MSHVKINYLSAQKKKLRFGPNKQIIHIYSVVLEYLRAKEEQ